MGLALGVIILFGPVNPRQEVTFTSKWVTQGAIRPGEVEKKNARTAEIEKTLFEGPLSYKTYKFETIVVGSPETYSGGFVHAPGHHLNAVAALSLDGEKRPLIWLRSSDLQASRLSRGEPYALPSVVAGLRETQGESGDLSLVAGLFESTGLKIVDGSARALGADITPTMPLESTECESYFLGVVHTFTPVRGSGATVIPLSVKEAWELFESGKVSDAGRAQALYGRALDSIGYLRSHDVYATDFPALKERFDTLGMGEVWDLRATQEGQAPPKLSGRVRPTREARESAVVIHERKISLDHGEMVESRLRGADSPSGRVAGASSEIEAVFLKLPHDRLKVAEYYLDEGAGPMVRLFTQVRAPLEFAPGKPRVLRRDVMDGPIERDLEFPGTLENTVELGRPTSASASLSDLYYRFGATEMETPAKPKGEGYVTLAEALRECRSGQGDAQTEALLLRLADHLRWNPNLGMSWESIDRAMQR